MELTDGILVVRVVDEVGFRLHILIPGIFLQEHTHLGGVLAVLCGDLARVLAYFDQDVAVAGLRGHILREEADGGGTVVAVGTDILLACLRGELAAVGADRVVICAGIGKITVFQSLMQGFHDLVPHSDGRVGPGIGQDDLLRLVVAAPDNGGIVGRVAGKPAGLVVVGGTCLAGDGHVAHIGRRAGAVGDNVSEHIIHIEAGLFADGGVALLGVVEDYIAVGVDNLGVGPGLTENAVVGEGGIGLGHFPHRQAVGQLTQAKGRVGDVGIVLSADLHIVDQGGNAQLLGQKIIAVLQAQQVQGLDRHGVDRAGNGAQNGAVARVAAGVVFRPARILIER